VNVVQRCARPFCHQSVPQVIVAGVLPCGQVFLEVFVDIEYILAIFGLLYAVTVTIVDKGGSALFDSPIGDEAICLRQVGCLEPISGLGRVGNLYFIDIAVK